MINRENGELPAFYFLSKREKIYNRPIDNFLKMFKSKNEKQYFFNI